MPERKPVLLVVDDEEFNRELIGEYLDDSTYTLDYAVDGQEAWEKLDARPDAYDAILLDRMMPRLSGIEVLGRIKLDPRLMGIPVILQTAATAPEQIEEGLQLGAYYYLSKPFPRQALEIVVATALADHQSQRDMRASLVRTQRVMHLLDEARFSFRTLEEAHVLGAELANMAASPATVVIGLTELLINAVEHGNLDLDYQDKSRGLEDGTWEALLQTRFADPLRSHRQVRVHCTFAGQLASLTIEDEGAGFDWQRFLAFDPERAFDLHGRGIALARGVSFTSLEYQGCGNCVRVTFPLA